LIESRQGGWLEPVRLDQPPCGISNHSFRFHLGASMKIRTLFGMWATLGVLCLEGCGGGNTIWVTGVLQKGGEPYKPPEERKLALYFYPIAEGTAANPVDEPEMADYDPRDGSFTVPGREGHGIAPGKYRIAIVETLRREARDALNKGSKPKRGTPRITNDTDFLEASFGKTTSPFVRDLKTSTKLTLDMASPTG
jgi:hypothetical protein